MSVDGPGIIDSDDAHDTYNMFMDSYDEGMEIPAIVESMLATWSWIEDSGIDAFYEELCMVALAQALWETGGVPGEIVSIIDRIIDSGRSLQEWKEENEGLARQRRRVLLRFRKKIRQPRAKPRRRIPPMAVADQIYQVGECLTMQREGGEAAAFIVLNVLRYRGSCDYFIGFMEIARNADSALISHSTLRSIRGSLVSAGSLELDSTLYGVGSFHGVGSLEVLEESWLDRVVRESVWRTRSLIQLIDLAPILKR